MTTTSTTKDEIKTMQRNLLKNLIMKTNGMIFSASFIKANGLYRQGSFRMGVKKGVKGTGTPLADDSPNIRVYDMTKKAFRTINVDRLLSLKCGSRIAWTKGEGSAATYFKPPEHSESLVLEPEYRVDEVI